MTQVRQLHRKVSLSYTESALRVCTELSNEEILRPFMVLAEEKPVATKAEAQSFTVVRNGLTSGDTFSPTRM